MPIGSEQDELHPEVGEDLLAQGRVETGFQAQRQKVFARWLRLPSSSPKIMRMKVPTCVITPAP